MADVYRVVYITFCTFILFVVTEINAGFDVGVDGRRASTESITRNLEKLVDQVFQGEHTENQIKFKLTLLREKFITASKTKDPKAGKANADFLVNGLEVLLKEKGILHRRQLVPVSPKALAALPAEYVVGINETRLRSDDGTPGPLVTDLTPPASPFREVKDEESCGCACLAFKACQETRAARQFHCQEKCANQTKCNNTEYLECLQKVSATIRHSTVFVTKHCFKSSAGIFFDQIQILKSVEGKLKPDTHGNLHELGLVLDAVALRLHSIFCPKNEELAEKMLEQVVQDTDHAKVPSVVQKKCECVGEWCTHPDCRPSCRAMCRRRALHRWQCPASSSAITDLPLNIVCDGKIDCLDKSDEDGCKGDASRRLRANQHLEAAIKKITLKQNNYPTVRSKLLLLTEDLKDLQKRLSKDDTVPDIVHIADKILLEFAVVYPKGNVGRIPASRDVYELLADVKGSLVEVVRGYRSNSSLSATCFCRGGFCVAMRCTVRCVRRCHAEQQLGHQCSDAKPVPLDTICDGYKNCLNGEDELKCNKGLCHRHQFMKVLQDVEKFANHKGGTVGLKLQSWKNTLVSNGTDLLAQHGRPTRKLWLSFVEDGVKELAECYVALEPNSRPSGHDADAASMQILSEVANILYNSLHYCSA